MTIFKTRYILLLIFMVFMSSTQLFGHGISQADKLAMIEGGNLSYVWLGTTHMLSGYDHLLFLFGVMFFLKTFRDVVIFISMFTLGHSITLIFATFMGITANYYLIDAVIAISVIYKGFDNNKGFENYLGVKAPNLLAMVFLFGLIHGFGLSTRLQELPLGEQGTAMLAKIVSFNIGVELGQIVALVLMLLVLTQWRKTASFLGLSKVANHALMFLGFMLLLMQLHGYLHMVNEEEFGFNRDEHSHIHQDMKEAQQQNYVHDSL